MTRKKLTDFGFQNLDLTQNLNNYIENKTLQIYICPLFDDPPLVSYKLKLCWTVIKKRQISEGEATARLEWPCLSVTSQRANLHQLHQFAKRTLPSAPAGVQVRVEVLLADLPEAGPVPGAHSDAPGAADLPVPPLPQGLPLPVRPGCPPVLPQLLSAAELAQGDCHLQVSPFYSKSVEGRQGQLSLLCQPKLCISCKYVNKVISHLRHNIHLVGLQCSIVLYYTKLLIQSYFS